MAGLAITQRRSGIGGKHNQRATLRTLGLHRIGERVLRPDTPEVRGMLAVVTHLVTVETVDNVAVETVDNVAVETVEEVDTDA